MVRAGSALVGAVATAMLAASCSSAGGTPHGGTASVSVVASTNVYGDIVKQIAGTLAGKFVRVTSIISDPGADPHSYEADARTQLAISRSDVIVENGAGYDDFVDTMRKAAGNSPTVLKAADAAAPHAADGKVRNEHIWYDLPSMVKLVDQIAAALSAKDSSGASTFRANASRFKAELVKLEAVEAAIKAAHSGEGVAITEPVPLYLLEACGLVNRTPSGFSNAIEQGDDVPAAVLLQTLRLLRDRRVKLLAYNEQASSAETRQVLATAKGNGVAIVPVTETLPPGTDYLRWIGAILSAVEAALSR